MKPVIFRSHNRPLPRMVARASRWPNDVCKPRKRLKASNWWTVRETTVEGQDE